MRDEKQHFDYWHKFMWDAIEENPYHITIVLTKWLML
jgi:hypothetical protein